MCAAAGSSTSSTSNHLGTSPPHLVAHVTVPSIPDATFAALLDCGCSHSFISSDLVSKFRLSRKSLLKPIKLTLFDGSAPNVIKNTVEVPIRFSSGLIENWSFFETTLAEGYHFALGLDWLHHRNPSIDWSNSTLSFGSVPTSGTSLSVKSEDSRTSSASPVSLKSEDSRTSSASPVSVSSLRRVDRNHSTTAHDEQFGNPSPSGGLRHRRRRRFDILFPRQRGPSQSRNHDDSARVSDLRQIWHSL